MSDPDIEHLAQTAIRLANDGYWDEAETYWQRIRNIDPRHTKALFSLGVHALKRGSIDDALMLLQEAYLTSPRDLLVLLTLRTAYQKKGDYLRERECIEQALAVDAYFLPALLAKAEWLERAGNYVGAANTFANCLKIAPPETHWPDVLRPQLKHAQAVVYTHVERYHNFLSTELSVYFKEFEQQQSSQWLEAISILAGKTKPYRSESNQLHIPRLPAIPFFDRKLFAWIPFLEAQTTVIYEELQNLLVLQDIFVPYIAYGPGDPVNQWQDLNHSKKWSVLHLWRSGVPVTENLEHCPKTAQALRELDLAAIDGLCPNVMFSVLAPHTHIPPHHGETNARLVAHLPLIVPPSCRLRVGFEERTWKVGEVIVFDDTIEHEAYNDSDELRVVLIFDVWNPLLSLKDREMVKAMAAAARKFAAK